LHVPLQRPVRAQADVALPGVPAAPANHDHLHHPLLNALSKAQQRLEGVPIREIVKRVKPRPEATFVMQRADPDYTTNTALVDLVQDDVILALKHNGRDLEPDHGGPMRLVLPKLYFWKSSKWLRAFEFLDVNPPGFWEQNGY